MRKNYECESTRYCGCYNGGTQTNWDITTPSGKKYTIGKPSGEDAYNVRFIIKVIDKKEGGWGYIWNGCNHVMGKNGSFTEDNTFTSIEEAETHIKAILNSGWYRDDVTREYFEIIPVKQYKELDFCFFWYTEDYYNEIRSLH